MARRHPVASLRPVVTELRGDGTGLILVAVASGWVLSTGVRYTYPSLMPFFRADFGFSLAISSLLISVLWIAYAIGLVRCPACRRHRR